MNKEESTTTQSFNKMVSLCSRSLRPEKRQYVLVLDIPDSGIFLQKMNQRFDTFNPSLPFERRDKEKLDTVAKILCDWSNKSRRRTVECRVIWAIINASFLKNEIKSFIEKHGLKQGTGTVIQQASLDAVEPSHGKKIKLKEIKQQQQDKTISRCVNFISSDDNLSSVAWGTKKVLLQYGRNFVAKINKESNNQGYVRKIQGPCKL